jgi:hypothetical protein
MLDILRLVKPPVIYIAADAPRENHPEDQSNCAQVMNEFRAIDWNCDVKYKVNSVNLGSWHAIPAAIDWFFLNEPMGIVLEDDCIPSQTFFAYCGLLLHKYQNDERVMWINGSNLGWNDSDGLYSYSYTKYAISWGWASWRRAWCCFQDYRNGPASKDKIKSTLDVVFPQQRNHRLYWSALFDYAYSFNNWDYRWMLAMWASGGVVCTPSVNLISNIGFGIEAVHGGSKNNPMASLVAHECDGELLNRQSESISRMLDRHFDRVLYKIGLVSIVKIRLIVLFPWARSARAKLKRYVNRRIGVLS